MIYAPKFKLKTLIIWIVSGYLIVYLVWSFIVMSFTEPIESAFGSTLGRGLFVVWSILGTIFWYPFADYKKDEFIPYQNPKIKTPFLINLRLQWFYSKLDGVITETDYRKAVDAINELEYLLREIEVKKSTKPKST